MTRQVTSSIVGGYRRRAAGMRSFVLRCVLTGSLFFPLRSQLFAQETPSSRESERYRFQVVDGETDLPVAGAQVSLRYLQKRGATEERKEIEVNTNKNGIADFPVLEGNKLAVSVTAKGYRSYWRWIHRNASAEITRVQLERWAKRPT
jgi:hypothetical protein